MNLNTYQKVAITTVLATIFLIFVGGLVRAAGAGLGCPDWPKCFGMWIPPTSPSELPASFDASQFNVFKTWTEYINRLVGVMIGLLILATFALSFRYRKSTPAVFYSSMAAFVLVLFQGWLGGQVVITGLSEWLITIHMLVAMIIMTVLLYAVFKASEDQIRVSISPHLQKKLYWSGVILLLFTMLQLILGTQVREAIDLIKDAASVPPREVWLSQIGAIDEYHRTFSWSIFLAGIVVFYFGKWKAKSRLLGNLSSGIMLVIMVQIALGAGLYYMDMPPAFQVLHLVGIAVMISLNVLLLLVLRKGMRAQKS
ncbi:MAG: COX15/CtaA family protein [Balneolaceae bacterium]|nr:COX15/CtaA family protein [Balneolaceae bacterium]